MISVDSGFPQRVPFQQCRKEGCVGSKKISKAFKQKLIQGEKLKAMYKVVIKRKGLSIPVSISLAGLQKGLLALAGENKELSEEGGEKLESYQYPLF